MATLILFGIVVLAVLVVACQAARYLEAKIGESRFGKRTRLDAEVFDALGIAVQNIGTKTVDAARHDKAAGRVKGEDWQRWTEQWEELALADAHVLLNPDASARLRDMGRARTALLIRYLVDRREAERGPAR